jgi:hypothetical protein
MASIDKTKAAPVIGDTVIYHQPNGVAVNALVVQVWSNWTNPAINLVYVSPDTNRTDSSGRQIERASSVSHGSMMSAHGNYWRRADEPVNEYQSQSAQ